MKAFVRTSRENGHVTLTDVPVPGVNADEVLIAVQAFGVGIHDRYFIPESARFPYPIGIEGAGIVERIGSDVTNVDMGARVIFSSSMQPRGGSWAEYVAVRSRAVVPMPDGMDFTQAAVLPVAGKTALESMRALDLHEGNTLFIAGASGAVGTIVIQLAKAQGVRIAASASSRNHDYLRSLGVEKTVDYSSPSWKADVREWTPGGVDAALAIQPGTAEDSMDIVKDGGTVITVSGDRVQPRSNVSVRQFQHQLDMQEAVGQLAEDIAAGKFRTVIEHVYPFDEALAALKTTELRHARGKRVVSFAASTPRAS